MNSDPETLTEVYQLPWVLVEGAHVRVQIEKDDNDIMAPASEYDPEKIRHEEREGEVVGRAEGTGLYYDSGRGEPIPTSIGPAVFLDTPEDTVLEVRTDKIGNELLEYTPPEAATE